MSAYPFTAMNTLKGQRIRTKASAGNAIGLENWFNIDKIHKIYQTEPVPFQLLKLNEVYLLAAPAGLPIRLVRLDVLTPDGGADLFDVQRQETITVALGPEYQLHKYYPDAIIPTIRSNLNVTSGNTRSSNFESVGGGKMRRRTNRATKKRGQRGGIRFNPFVKKKNSPFTNRNSSINAGKSLANMTNAELQTQYNASITHGAHNLANSLMAEQIRRLEASLAQQIADTQRVTNAITGSVNPAREAGLNAAMAALEAEIAAEKQNGGGGKLVNLSRVNTSRMYSPALGKSNINVLLNRINAEMKGTRKNSRNNTRKNNFTFDNPKRSAK